MDRTLVIARFLPKAGSEPQVEEILREMVVKTRQEPGNEIYDLFKSVSDGGIHFVLLERYADDAALQFHRDSPHYKDYRINIMPLLENPIAVSILEPMDMRDF